MAEETELSGDGHPGESEVPETIEELEVITKNLKDLERPGVVRYSKEQLTLFKQMVQVPDAPEPSEVFLRLIPLLDFRSDEERAKHMKAFDEADRLGMDLMVNIRYTLSLCAVNRGGHKSSRIGALLESWSHQTHTLNTSLKGKKYGNINSRSPLE